jgi:hypothetical protein
MVAPPYIGGFGAIWGDFITAWSMAFELIGLYRTFRKNLGGCSIEPEFLICHLPLRYCGLKLIKKTENRE